MSNRSQDFAYANLILLEQAAELVREQSAIEFSTLVKDGREYLEYDFESYTEINDKIRHLLNTVTFLCSTIMEQQAREQYAEH